jgi:endoglucanase
VARDAEAGFSDGAVDATSGSDVSTYADAMRGFDATSGDGGADASFRNEAGADATANAGVLRGVNLFGGWQGDYGGIDTFGPTTTLDYFRGKGLTTFRVGISWVDLQPTLNGPLSSSYLAMMDALVQNAKARGEGVAFVPLPGTYQGNDVGSSAVPIAALSNLWTQLASHYKNEPTIWGYDLLNEPNMGDSWNTTIAPQVIAAIRTVDTGHAIIVPTSTGGYGYNWANHTVGLPMSDPSNHLIYEAHFYFDTPPNGQYPDVNAVPSDVDAGAESAQAFVSWCIANHARCYAGEYGVPGGWTGGTELCTNGAPYTDPVWLTVLDNFLSYLDRNGILGTYWAGGPYGDVNDVGPTCAGVDRPQMAILEKHLGF